MVFRRISNLPLSWRAKGIPRTDPPGTPDAPVRDLTGVVDRDERSLLGKGTYGEVYKGKWIKAHPDFRTRPEVVVKVFCMVGTITPRIAKERSKKLRRELTVWGSIRHRNIVPFLGVATISGSLPSLVSIYMPRGTLTEYLKRNPGAPRKSIAIDIAQGLQYLHEHNPSITHGDLKPDNVVFDKYGTACLCDFGLSRMDADGSIWVTAASQAPGTIRFMAPELLNGSQPTVTNEGDIYAYGMTCFTLYSGLMPLRSCKKDFSVPAAVTAGLRPERETISHYINDRLWDLWTECWDGRISNRPTATEALDVMVQIEP